MRILRVQYQLDVQNDLPLESFSTELPYRVLGHEFYYGMRNEFTQDREALLIDIARKIQQPTVYGSYDNESHFLNSLDFFLKSTNETRHRGMFFLREILPQIKDKNYFIDVGFGNGILTKWVGSKFRNLLLVDSNSEAIANFTSHSCLSKKHQTINKIHDSILEIELAKNCFDLGLLSHVLYYVDEHKWIEATTRLYNAIKPGGILVVVLNGDQYGKINLIQHFNGRLIEIDKYVSNCIDVYQNATINLYKSVETMRSYDLLSMLHLAGFFLYDVGAKATSHELTEYLNTYCRDTKGCYEIQFPQKFIVIKKQ